MKKVGTVTFHASHNVGSNLQAYALQEFVKEIAKKNEEPIEYKIINLRTKEQRDLYNYRKTSRGIKKLAREMLFSRSLKKKEDRFEDFINHQLNLTKTYETEEELKKGKLDFDYYISGSDQLWNLTAYDFNWSYYLDFVKSGKKISYAASFGPLERFQEKNTEEKIAKLLEQYDALSVREEGSKKRVENLIKRVPDIHVDPTLLIPKEKWEAMIKDDPIIKGDYIFFYSFKMSKERVLCLKKISRRLKMPIIVMNPLIKYDIMGGFTRVYDAGPLEFLNLIKYAKLVISASFHGTVFSILLQRPFYSLNGMKDLRISNLLKLANLENRNLMVEDDLDTKLQNVFDVDFSKSKEMIKKQRSKSEEYLKKALDIKEKDGNL